MTIKERFTIYRHVEKGYPSWVMDNKTQSIISEMEAEIICQEEYGEFFSAKTNYISKVLDTIIAQINLYNKSCEEGFEITMGDIITKFKQKEKADELHTITESRGIQ